MIKLYLAGPMTGIADYNYPAFHAYAKKLRDKGNMYASLGHNASNSSVEITIGQDYAPFHQFGTSKMVARKFFPTEILSQTWEQDILHILDLHLNP
jgi:phage gpG-like protein